MGIKPPDITQPFPTESMIKRGGGMQVQEQGEDEWLVWQPGHEMHLVKKEIKFYTCDCTGFQIRNVCSHVAAVRMGKAEKDKEELFPSL